MKIETGTPKTSGRYACYIDVDLVATIVRVYSPGTGWISNLKEPICGKIVAWVGPLPVKGDQPVTAPKGNGLLCRECGAPQFETISGDTCENGHGGVEGVAPTPMEFDL